MASEELINEVEEDLGSLSIGLAEEQSPKKELKTENYEEIDLTMDTLSEDEPINLIKTPETAKQVEENLGEYTVADEKPIKEAKTTEIIEQLEEDLGGYDLGSAEEEFRQAEKDKLINEEAEVRAEEKAQVIVNQTIRSATEVLNEQNLLATKEAEQSIRERQYRLEQKIKKNKYRDIRGKIGTAIFMAVMIVGLYICYSNPTLNSGIRSVLSNTLGMFSDLIAGKEVDSNGVVESLGTELNENTMKYEYKIVDEDGNELIEE